MSSTRYFTFLMLSSVALGFRGYNTSRSINNILDSAKYDRRIRPYHLNSTLDITVFITLVSFGDVTEMKSEFSLDMFFGQIWKDPRLHHNQKDGVILSGKDGRDIWLPDTFFMNIKEGQLHNVPTDNSQVLINMNGEVRYSTRITLTASCEMDLHRYPLDEQTCMLQIMSYAYNEKEIDYRWRDESKSAILLINDHLAQFTLEDYQIGKRTRAFPERYTELMLEFKFQRRIGYALLQIYFPTILIVCLSWLSFWISKDAVPARVALGITTVLTLVTLNGSLRASSPKVSYIKAMDLYLIVTFFFVFGAVMEYIAVLTYDEFVKQRKALAKKLDNSEKDDEEKEVKKPEEDNDVIVKVPKELFGFEEEANGNTVKRQSKMELEDTSFLASLKMMVSINSTPIDQYSKVFFPVLFALFNVAYWLYYSLYQE